MGKHGQKIPAFKFQKFDFTEPSFSVLDSGTLTSTCYNNNNNLVYLFTLRVTYKFYNFQFTFMQLYESREIFIKQNSYFKTTNCYILILFTFKRGSINCRLIQHVLIFILAMERLCFKSERLVCVELYTWPVIQLYFTMQNCVSLDTPSDLK